MNPQLQKKSVCVFLATFVLLRNGFKVSRPHNNSVGIENGAKLTKNMPVPQLPLENHPWSYMCSCKSSSKNCPAKKKQQQEFKTGRILRACLCIEYTAKARFAQGETKQLY